MDEPLIKVTPTVYTMPGPLLQKTAIVQFYQNHQNYKTLTLKFHTILFYIFCIIQPIWFVLSYNIITINNYNYFIKEFEQNFNNNYKPTYEQNRSTYVSVLDHVNSFANDYTIICWLVWLAHLGFYLVLGYILYANRIFFKDYSTSLRDILPVFFTLLTTLVIRDCLLMSVSQVVQDDLQQISSLIAQKQHEFSTYGDNFYIFISTTINSAFKLHSDFANLQIISTLQQICDVAIICALTLQIFRIYSMASKCQKNQQELISKKLYAIHPLIVSHQNISHHNSELGSKFSQESQYPTSLNNDGFFHYLPKLLTSQKEMIPGHSLRSINISEENSYNSRFHKKQKPPNVFKVKTLKSSSPQIVLRKLKKSGSCNYLKGSHQISEQDIVQPTTAQHIHEDHIPETKLKKGASINSIMDSQKPKRPRIESFDALNFHDSHVLFKV